MSNANTAPVLTAAEPSLGTTDIKTAKTIALAERSSTTARARPPSPTPIPAPSVGGIALTGVTGKGTWAYSLDGTTFTAVGTVADNSALLLPTTASLRYTPDGTDAETATITYRAWDTTTGQAGSKVDTSTNGGATAFSTAADTASLTVAGSSLSGYVYLDSNNDGQRAASETGLAGVTVRLYSQDSSGNWTEVAGASPVQTAADGSYSSRTSPPERIRSKSFPSSVLVAGQATVGAVGGSARGTAGADQFQVQLATGENGSQYNFGILGTSAELHLLAAVPRLDPADAASDRQHVSERPRSIWAGARPRTSTESAPAAIVSSAASISSPDSPTLASMTVTIQNVLDGSAEQLQAATSGTAHHVELRRRHPHAVRSGRRGRVPTVLQSITYSDTALSPTIADRTISIVVNDGTSDSAAVTTTVTVVPRLGPQRLYDHGRPERV